MGWRIVKPVDRGIPESTVDDAHLVEKLRSERDEHAGFRRDLEGASRWTVFRRITFPLLMPTTLFVLVNAVINSFRLVDHIVVMTRGGPDNTTSLLLYYIYEVGFKFWDAGYAAALTMVLLVLLAAAAVLQFGFLEKRIHYR